MSFYRVRFSRHLQQLVSIEIEESAASRDRKSLEMTSAYENISINSKLVQLAEICTEDLFELIEVHSIEGQEHPLYLKIIETILQLSISFKIISIPLIIYY